MKNKIVTSLHRCIVASCLILSAICHLSPPARGDTNQLLSALATSAALTHFQVGQPFAVGSQSFLVTTNDLGQFIIVSTGTAGTITNIPPMNQQDLLNRFTEYVAANNPANSGYYGTNDFNLKVGAIFAQNSGQAFASIGVEKFGLIKSRPEIGFGAAVLEGNASGQNGTAGFYGGILYRRIIGDVAITGGVGGGYDKYNSKPMAVLKLDLEYRHNQHLGEYVGLGYAVEQRGKGGGADRGLMIGGGIVYAF
jgi:hypothetical protein